MEDPTVKPFLQMLALLPLVVPAVNAHSMDMAVNTAADTFHQALIDGRHTSVAVRPFPDLVGGLSVPGGHFSRLLASRLFELADSDDTETAYEVFTPEGPLGTQDGTHGSCSHFRDLRGDQTAEGGATYVSGFVAPYGDLSRISVRLIRLPDHAIIAVATLLIPEEE